MTALGAVWEFTKTDGGTTEVARSVEHFPEYVNAIAGYDVATLAEKDSTSAYYACAAAGEDGPNAWCSARFPIQHSGRNYDVVVEVGGRRYGETRKPAEVTVLHGES